MGTRGNIIVLSEWGENKPLLHCHFHFDGYYEGVGLRVAKFAGSHVVVNGITNNTPAVAANGMSCFAAFLVAEFKTEIGGFYIDATETDFDSGYTYVLYLRDKTPMFDKQVPIYMKVSAYGRQVYDGLASAFTKAVIDRINKNESNDYEDAIVPLRERPPCPNGSDHFMHRKGQSGKKWRYKCVTCDTNVYV